MKKESNRKNPYRICRNDVFLAASLAIAAVVLFMLFFVLRSGAAGNSVYVTLDGKEYGRYDLGRNAVVEILSENGKNVLEIRDGKVSMREADCPDGYCVAKGQIRREGETIVCLPHRLVAEIRSEGLQPYADMHSHEGTQPQEDLQSSENGQLQGDVQSHEAASSEEDVQSHEAVSPQEDVQLHEAAPPEEDVQSHEAASPEEDVQSHEAASSEEDVQLHEAVSPQEDIQSYEYDVIAQ